MGSLILCHKKRARQPYEISRVHLKIYTLEELCYYICNNLYLLDYTIINRQLCDWLRDELELKTLAKQLREALNQNCSMEQFVLMILRTSTIYSTVEINKIQNILERLQNQKDVERTKYKADSLQNSGEYESAILVYQSIINAEWDDSVDKTFYGRIYACLGAAYGHLFLYKEAADMYQEAYKICGDSDMMKAYLYCCYRGLPEDQYVKMLSGNSEYLSMDAVLKTEMRKARKEVNLDLDESELDNWKRDYRRTDKK
jgi:tetratricopeptide (TPR) repeat protein